MKEMGITHIIQGVNNSITPEEYDTEENLQIAIKQHQIWIESELQFLRNHDCSQTL